MCVLVHTFGGLFIHLVVLLFPFFFGVSPPIDCLAKEKHLPPPSSCSPPRWQPSCFSPKSPNCTRKRGEAFWFNTSDWVFLFFSFFCVCEHVSVCRADVLPLSHADSSSPPTYSPVNQYEQTIRLGIWARWTRWPLQADFRRRSDDVIPIAPRIQIVNNQE